MAIVVSIERKTLGPRIPSRGLCVCRYIWSPIQLNNYYCRYSTSCYSKFKTKRAAVAAVAAYNNNCYRQPSPDKQNVSVASLEELFSRDSGADLWKNT